MRRAFTVVVLASLVGAGVATGPMAEEVRKILRR
jgi:hypothetical protein